MSIRNYLKATKVAMNNLFTKPNTVLFPTVAVETPEGYRGPPVLEPEICTLCKKCIRVCPTHALNVEEIGEDQFTFSIDLGKCCYCSECEGECTFGAIKLEETWMTSEMVKDLLKRSYTVTKGNKKNKGGN